jgi:dUTP pyrophosphatase
VVQAQFNVVSEFGAASERGAGGYGSTGKGWFAKNLGKSYN